MRGMKQLQHLAKQGMEAVSAQPLVELLSDRRVLVEHHRGVLAYGPGEILVAVAFGQLRIWGCGLVLARMRSDQLVICGKIGGLELLSGRGSNGR